MKTAVDRLMKKIRRMSNSDVHAIFEMCYLELEERYSDAMEKSSMRQADGEEILHLLDSSNKLTSPRLQSVRPGKKK